MVSVLVNVVSSFFVFQMISELFVSRHLMDFLSKSDYLGKSSMVNGRKALNFFKLSVFFWQHRTFTPKKTTIAAAECLFLFTDFIYLHVFRNF